MRSLALAAALAASVLLFPQTAFAQKKTLKGEPAPELSGSGQVQGDPFKDLASLRGRCVLIHFFSSGDASTKQEMADLQRLHVGLVSQGLVVIGVTDEGKPKAEEWAKTTQVTYTILSASKKSAYGVEKTPRFFLIGPTCRVGLESEKPIEGPAIQPFLRQVTIYQLPEGTYSKKFETITKAYCFGDFKSIASDLARLSHEKGEDGENAKRLQGWITSIGNKKLGEADKAKDEGNFFGALNAWLELEVHFPSNADAAIQAKARLAELKKDEKAKEILPREKDYDEACRLDAEGKGEAAARAFRVCASGACKGTTFADWCEKKASAAEAGGGRPGGGGGDK